MWTAMKNRKKKSSHFSGAIADGVSDFAREMSGGSGEKDKAIEEKKESPVPMIQPAGMQEELKKVV
jgi:hypothetical protein